MGDAELLSELLRAYSPSGAEGPGVTAFGRIAHQLGFTVNVDEVGNGIARFGHGRPQVVYLGHVDTVPGELEVRPEGDLVYGRGACDAKGPLLAALLARPRHLPTGEFVVIAAVGEETDSRGARHLLESWRPDAVIAGEPSGWDGLAVGYKGDLRLRVTFDGPRRHLSSPEASAVERALAWTDGVRALLGPGTGENRFLELTGKVASFRSSEDGDRTSAEVVIDLRLPPGLRTAELRGRLPSPSGPHRIETIAEIEPFATERTHPVVRALVRGIRTQGGNPTLWRKGGTSDLNLVAPAWALGGAAYGPGDAHLDHTDGERLDVAELRRGAEVLRSALEELVAQSPATLRGSGLGAE